MMKRARDVVDEQAMTESLATVANYLMLLSRTSPITSTTTTSSETTTTTTTTARVFECKTCNRQFPSFQALGGHRASHKKPRLSEIGAHSSDSSSNTNTSPAKPKTHECSICGLEFAIGQALGGHMRRHRAVYAADGGGLTPSTALSLSLSCPATATKKPVTVTNKAGGAQALCLDLDLNLTPMENGLEVGKLAAIFG